MKVCYCALSSCPNANTEGWPVIRNSIPDCVETEPDEADIVIVYLCAMTIIDIRRAEEKLEELIEFKKSNPGVKLIVGGCLNSIKGLEKNYGTIYSLLYSDEIDCLFSRETMVEDILSFLGFKRKPLVPVFFTNKYAAVVQIASGCKHRCAFCKAWYLDMPYRFLPIEDVMEAVEFAAKKGVTRLDVTGENITEYDTDCSGRSRLIVLLKKIIRKFPSIKIINLFGICLDEMDEHLFRFILNQPKIRVIQLEIQSLDPNVRKAMRLTKPVSDVIRMVTELSREHNVQSSIMVGHPGETPEGIMQQLSSIVKNGMYFLRPIKYINTPQTRSYDMQQIPEEIADFHLTLLSGMIADLRINHVESVLGRTIHMYVVGETSDCFILLPVGGTFEVTTKKVDGVTVGDKVSCYIDSYTPWDSNSGQNIDVQRRLLQGFYRRELIMMLMLNPVDNMVHLGGQIMQCDSSGEPIM